MVQPSRTHNQSSILLTDAELDDINRWTHWGSCLWWEAVEKILRRCTIYLRALFFPATTWVCARLLWALRLPTSLTAFHRTGSVTNGSYMKISTQGLETAFKMLPPPTPAHLSRWLYLLEHRACFYKFGECTSRLLASWAQIKGSC